MMGVGGAVAAMLGALVQVLVLVGLVQAARGQGGPPLVIRQWSATTAPADPEATYVQIVGRREGIVAWFLTLLGVDVTTTLRVNARNVVLHEATIFGHRRVTVPLRHVSHVVSGYTRPLVTAILVFMVISGVGTAISVNAHSEGGAIVAFVVGVVAAVLVYALNKRFLLEVASHTRPLRIEFKRSVIENQKIDEDQAEQVVALLKTLLDGER